MSYVEDFDKLYSSMSVASIFYRLGGLDNEFE